MVADITRDGMYTTPSIDFLTEEGAKKSRPMKKGDVILTVSGNPGLPTILAVDSCIHDGLVGFRNLKTDLILSEFFYFCLLMMKEMHGSMSVGAVFRNLNTDQIRKFKIPLPDLNSQKLIVAKIEREMELIAANKELITLFEQKIKDKIASVWGE
jgi:restriction endonuclease S subunit